MEIEIESLDFEDVYVPVLQEAGVKDLTELREEICNKVSQVWPNLHFLLNIGERKGIIAPALWYQSGNSVCHVSGRGIERSDY